MSECHGRRLSNDRYTVTEVRLRNVRLHQIRNHRMTHNRQRSWLLVPLGLLGCLAVLAGFSFVSYRPDRPVPTIDPGSSPGPAFVVQIIRPRSGLPLGGLLPPKLFGLESHLGFGSDSPGAFFGRVDRGRVELGADHWEMALGFDEEGQLNSETRVVFELLLQDRVRKVRARVGQPVIGTCEITELSEAGTLSGHFDIELPHCEDFETGKALGWPPQPFLLHGSFDRLPRNASMIPQGSSEN